MDSVPEEIIEEYELKEIDIIFEKECYYNEKLDVSVKFIKMKIIY